MLVMGAMAAFSEGVVLYVTEGSQSETDGIVNITIDIDGDHVSTVDMNELPGLIGHGPTYTAWESGEVFLLDPVEEELPVAKVTVAIPEPPIVLTSTSTNEPQFISYTLGAWTSVVSGVTNIFGVHEITFDALTNKVFQLVSSSGINGPWRGFVSGELAPPTVTSNIITWRVKTSMTNNCFRVGPPTPSQPPPT